MQKPVNISSLWFAVEDRIDDFMFNFLWVIGTGEVDQVRGEF